MQAPRLLANRLARQSTRNNVRYDHHASAQTNYNDLPQPQGNWKTHYDAYQRKYNAHLALGIGVFVGSILFGKVAGFWEFYNDIPEHPAKIDSYK